MTTAVLSVNCSECGATAQTYFDVTQTLKSQDVLCKKCGASCAEITIYEGYVYVLSNAALDGLIKIGSTERSVDERVAELNRSTAIPESFIVEAFFYCNHPKEKERLIHSGLQELRHNPAREYFKISPEIAITEATRILGYQPVYHRAPICAAPGCMQPAWSGYGESKQYQEYLCELHLKEEHEDQRRTHELERALVRAVTTNPIEIKCNRCRRIFIVGRDVLLSRVNCPSCGEPVVLNKYTWA